ncbi:unnamed protein product [Chrysodeixis includens]|uniref:Uncharacterized protein n=1 Tax=Chrysodeixis includens TaxID=689277 RepID=A0A9N8L4W8_CHRIL|nr:unnamed protein product [Chrysodeixis includens]
MNFKSFQVSRTRSFTTFTIYYGPACLHIQKHQKIHVQQNKEDERIESVFGHGSSTYPPQGSRRNVEIWVLRLISLRLCRIVIPPGCESKGTESAPVLALTLVHYNTSRVTAARGIPLETRRAENSFLNNQ